jgi:hypothetical protein
MADFYYHSAEIRWFFREPDKFERFLKWFTRKGQIPIEVEGNYDPKSITNPFVKKERERTDEYLLFPDSDMVGAKQRQGKLEVKALVASPRPFRFDYVIGRVDQWVKWSFESSDEDFRKQLDKELDQSSRWQKVVKDRYLQKRSFDTGVPVPVSPDQRPDSGCNIEVTRLRVLADSWDWFTFGFEAFGSSGRVIAILDEVVEKFFDALGEPPIQLEGFYSLNYPAWLASMLR